MVRPASIDDTVRALLDQPLDPSSKALPPLDAPVTLAEVGDRGWRALDGDLPLPVMLLKEPALAHNLKLMAAFCREQGLELAPHGKTTMAPQLVRRQLHAGAWGITAATATQARLFHRFGVRRILLANELLDSAGVRWAAEAVASDPELELHCLVDSVAGTRRLDELVGSVSGASRLSVLIELGVEGRRAGCRTTRQAQDVGSAVRRCEHLELAGVEAFEGVIGVDRKPETLAAVDDFLDWVREVAETLMGGGSFAGREEVIVTVGGSAYPDRVAAAIGKGWTPPQPVRRILRSGCYVTHDHGLYATVSPFGLRPAIEVWGVVLSRPEPNLAIVGFGKRDVPYDVGLPVPLTGRDLTVTELNDQHAFVHVPDASAVAVGQLVGCGISHPCTAFDKWALIPVVDDEYRVVDAIRTFF